ncbi:MAG TPA: DJ-1/PfpI family protein, partial [Spirochaetota bacterium]|nr:DJ-1/PfpI family protein [Spirochaetota bacterium]
MNILVPLAEGFEEIEAVTIIDILRRAGHTVTTASLKNKIVTGAHSIQITADKILTELRFEEFGAFILPGGMPGST